MRGFAFVFLSMGLACSRLIWDLRRLFSVFASECDSLMYFSEPGGSKGKTVNYQENNLPGSVGFLVSQQQLAVRKGSQRVCSARGWRAAWMGPITHHPVLCFLFPDSDFGRSQTNWPLRCLFSQDCRGFGEVMWILFLVTDWGARVG